MKKATQGISDGTRLSRDTNRRHNAGTTEADGITNSSVRDPPGQSSVHIPPGDHRRGEYRLGTFAKFPENIPVNTIDLATNGFYYTGHQDRVKCFSCGMAVSNWCIGDDACDRKWHKSDCDLMNNRECGNDPGQFSIRRAMFRAIINSAMGPSRNASLQMPCSFGQQSPAIVTQRPVIQVDSMSTQRSHNFPELRLAEIVSQEHRRLVLSLDLKREEDRRRTFARWPTYPAPELASKLAKEGFFYLGNLDRTQCFSCSGVLRNWCRTDTPRAEHRRHFPNCPIVMETETRNIPISEEQREQLDREEQQRIAAQRSVPPQAPPDPSPEEQRVLAEHYPCRNPVNWHMESFEDRLATFTSSWPSHRLRANSRDIAQAGFFALGEGDKAKCFYCNGGLQHWDENDEPWTEHAKWFPGCEYVLRKKGPEFVRRLAEDNPNLNRPPIRNTASYNIETNCSTSSHQGEVTGPPLIPVQSCGSGDACKMCKKEVPNTLCKLCGCISLCTACKRIARKCPACSASIDETVTFYRS